MKVVWIHQIQHVFLIILKISIYRVFQTDLNDKNTFPWGTPHYQGSNMAYNTLLDGAPCHYLRKVRNFLNETLPHRWIGRAVSNDQHLLTVLWPPRSPDLTPCDFFSYGDTLKAMPTNHHSTKMCVNCEIAFELRCKPLMGTFWSATAGRS